MESPIWFDTKKNSDSTLCISRGGGGGQVIISKKYCILLSEDLFLPLKNSVDPGEMQPYAAFHLGLHCLPKYSFRVFPNIQRVREPNLNVLPPCF